LGIFILPHCTVGDFHLTAPRVEKERSPNASTAIENQTFGAGVTKIMFTP